MTTLKIGDKAPNFESVDEKGNVIKLSLNQIISYEKKAGI